MGMPAIGTAAAQPPGFQWTPQDVKDAVADLMALLPPPKKVESTGQKACIAVVGPKGGKTISSLAIPTNKCGGLPRPKGSLVVVLYVDTTAPSSFADFCFDRGIEVAPEDEPIFVSISEPRGRYKARQKRSDPAQSTYVSEVVKEFLAALGQRGDVGLLLFDGAGDFYNQFGQYVAAHRNGFDSPLKLEGTHWYPRAEMIQDLLTIGQSAVVPGGFFIYNGPSGGFDTEKEKPELAAKLAKAWKKAGWSREPPAKWLMKRECHQNADAIIETEVERSANGEPIYNAEVWDGRLSRFGIKTGVGADITGANIGKFCDLAKAKAAASNGAAKVEVKAA